MQPTTPSRHPQKRIPIKLTLMIRTQMLALHCLERTQWHHRIDRLGRIACEEQFRLLGSSWLCAGIGKMSHQ
jgi:hypothetical protein